MLALVTVHTEQSDLTQVRDSSAPTLGLLDHFVSIISSWLAGCGADELVNAGMGERFDPGARKVNEWVSFPAGRANWIELAKEAYRFVKGSNP